MEELTLQVKEARRNYKRQYRIKNREKINQQQRAWRADNPDRVRRYQAAYWERIAAKAKNIRGSWEDYGITPERMDELVEVVRSGKHDDLVYSAAHRANETIAEYILLSVTQNKSYDTLEKLWARGEIGRMPYGKTDFYGIRRVFFHYLDCILNEIQEGQ